MNMLANVNYQLRTKSPKEKLVNALSEFPAVKNYDIRKQIAHKLENNFGCQIFCSGNQKLHVIKVVTYNYNKSNRMLALLHEIQRYNSGLILININMSICEDSLSEF